MTEHERTDVNIRAILGFALGLMVAAVFIHFLVWILFDYFASREAVKTRPEYPLAVGIERRVPPEPRLQSNPRADLRSLREQETATLTSYGWVDRNAGTVRIPIDQAMKLTLERGLPARKQ